ncbi:hypothetical protein EHV15_05300 [Paenibacillus oralis]|uniref:Uncharacterized protein n=1 Tax=Paenibacillus oralis TaxID=2490856 RepID=A0A3P3TWC4_9BACL|nr:hypothetical protein [Paenibacillus oralis]RRJ62431.1 hypothetical protein EHV15_05300 [Paenibacillus oralis]
MPWNELKKIAKTRRRHECAGTGKIIPEGSKCWHFVGEWEGEFQSWYLSEEAKQFMDAHPEFFNNPEGYECQEIGERMREFKEVSHDQQ